MPHHPSVSLSGVVTHIFAHRFVLACEDGAILADLTPHGQARFELSVGDRVCVSGERKPSEVKVTSIERAGQTIVIDHPHEVHHQTDADPALASRAAKAAGFKPVGLPKRKPKHFEVLGRRGDALTELHVELDGHIRKQKPVLPGDPKWASELHADLGPVRA